MSFLGILDHKYWERVPVQISTQVIDHLIVTMTGEELQQAGDTWKQVHLSTVISTRNTVESLNVPEYELEGVKGKICTMKEVIILPFTATVVKGIANLMTYSKCMHVVIEPLMGYSDHIATARPYGVLRAGRGKIDVCLSHSAKQITLPVHTAVGEITAVNVILALSAPKPTQDESDKDETTAQKGKGGSQKELLDKIYLKKRGMETHNGIY